MHKTTGNTLTKTA